MANTKLNDLELFFQKRIIGQLPKRMCNSTANGVVARGKGHDVYNHFLFWELRSKSASSVILFRKSAYNLYS